MHDVNLKPGAPVDAFCWLERDGSYSDLFWGKPTREAIENAARIGAAPVLLSVQQTAPIVRPFKGLDPAAGWPSHRRMGGMVEDGS